MSDGATRDEPGLPRIWEQQPRESDKAYGAFVIYRDLPVNERSGARVASEYRRHIKLIERWMRDWFWRERARAHDRHLEDEQRRRTIAERGKMAERQAAEAQVIQRVLFAPVRALAVKLADMIDREELDNMPVEGLYALSMASARLWPSVARAEREARGAPLPDWTPEDDDSPAQPLVLTEDFLAEVHLALEAANLSPAPRELPAPEEPDA